MSRVPTNLFTGFLGVGKTTAILDLLKRKPAQEKWAVLVNEFGEVGIDGAIIEGGSPDGVTVREVGGGCFCCTTAPYLPVALHFLFVDARPDRLLIETSGLGHPSGIIDTLRERYADRLELRATLGIIAPADFTCDGMWENPVFRDQVQMADVLVLNKLDTATPDVVQKFQAWGESLFPPKLLIAATSQGHLDPQWLDLMPHHEQLALQLASGNAESLPVPPSVKDLAPGIPLRFQGGSPSHPTCGWIFHPEEIFDEERLLACLRDRAEFRRIKGVFHVVDDWIAINGDGQSLTVNVSAYRRDSRVEVIAENGTINWDDLAAALSACLVSQGGN